MSAVQARKRVAVPFWMSADIPELLKQLAERHFTTPSAHIEKLVATAVRFIIRVQPVGDDTPFIARVRELAAQRPHPRAATTAGYSLGEAYMEGIRQLQNSLGLPRQGLVVEYLVRASWACEGDDDGGGGDELERRFRSTSRNLQTRQLAPAAAANPQDYTPGRQLVLLDEEDSSKS